jgi:hypothetical protein
LSARVQDVSRGGISLVAGYPFETGDLVSVELPGAADGSTTTVLAFVVRVAWNATGEWAVGCTFATELSDDELGALGARRLKPPPSDQRAWVRFPSDASATYQMVRSPLAKPRPATLLNVSPTGVGLLVTEAIEAGSLLNVEFRQARGDASLTIVASVTRVTAKAGHEWSLGCSFIRELTEKELAELL